MFLKNWLSIYRLSLNNIVLIPPQVDAMQASERVSNSWLPASSGDLGVSQRCLTLFRQSAARLLSQRLRSQPFLPAGQCYIAQIQAQLTPDVDTMTRCDVKCVDSLCPALDSTPQSGRSMDCWTSRGPKVFSKIIPTTWGKLCQSSAKVPKNRTNLQINRMVFHVGLCAAHLSSRQTWCIYTVWPWKKGKQQRILLRKVGKEILSPGSLSHISIINHLSILLSSCKEDEVLALNMQWANSVTGSYGKSPPDHGDADFVQGAGGAVWKSVEELPVVPRKIKQSIKEFGLCAMKPAIKAHGHEQRTLPLYLL